MDLHELIEYSNELHIDYVDICEAAKKKNTMSIVELK